MSPTLRYGGAAAIVLVLLFLLRELVRSWYFSPLARIPAPHFSCHFTDAWLSWRRYDATENSAVLAAHRHRGRVLRIAPNEVSINFVHGGVKSFAGSFEKSEWWPRLLTRYGTELPMAGFTSHRLHAFLRRAMNDLYSNTRLRNSPDFQKVLLAVVGDTKSELDRAVNAAEPINVFALGAGIGLDASSGHFLGVQHRSTSVKSRDEYVKWMWMLDADEVSSFWTTELPSVVQFLAWFGLVPWSKATQELRQDTTQLMLKSLQKAIEEVESSSNSSLYPSSDLLMSRPLLCECLKYMPKELPDSKSPRFYYLATELLDQLTAGSANLAVALGYCCFELSRNESMQKALQDEISEMETRLGHVVDAPVVPSPVLEELDKLPVLEACLTESMRIYPPVTGQLPRRVPNGGFSCDGFFIPEGVSVSAAAYNLHREESIFENPDQWDPWRWIKCSSEEQREMRAWLWSYGSGTYQCAGLHVARHSESASVPALPSPSRSHFTEAQSAYAKISITSVMNMWIASIYSSYSSRIVSEEGTEPQLSGLGMPVGRDLPIAFSSRKTG